MFATHDKVTAIPRHRGRIYPGRGGRHSSERTPGLGKEIKREDAIGQRANGTAISDCLDGAVDPTENYNLGGGRRPRRARRSRHRVRRGGKTCPTASRISGPGAIPVGVAPWENVRNIENREGFDSAYPNVYFNGNEALITFYQASSSGSRDTELMLRIYPIEWFYQPALARR